jgi:hypothetical protein
MLSASLQQCLGNVNSFEERIGLLGRKQESDLAICVEDLELAKSRQKELHSQLEALNERSAAQMLRFMQIYGSHKYAFKLSKAAPDEHAKCGGDARAAN